MKILRVTCCLLVLLFSLVAFAFVAVHSVAAQGLNPPPPEGATCQTTGQGTICQGSFSGSVIDQPINSCGSFDVIQNGTFTVPFTVFYDQAGNETKGIFHVNEVGTLSNSVTGKSVPFFSHNAVIFTYGTPGDDSTVTLIQPGEVYTVTLPGSGLILHDVGRVIFAPDGTITFEAGPHQLLHGEVQKLCAALS